MKNFKLYRIQRNEFNLCGIFGIPVQIEVNILDPKLPIQTNKLFCRFNEQNLQLLKKSIPENNHKFLGFTE